jgi:uncharacterized damage-inducible protein DinB
MAVGLKERFALLARYNARANVEMYDALSRVTERARRRDTGSWFGSIHGILNHVIVADINWLRRYRALSPGSKALSDACLDPPELSWERPLHEDFGGLAAHRGAVDAAIRAWFDELPESRYGDVFEYRDSAGSMQQAVACDAFDFLFVHQAHHRGQVSQILDELGAANNWADNKRFLSREGG